MHVHGGVALAGDGAGVAGWVDDQSIEIGLAAAVASRMLLLPLRFGPAAMARLQRHERHVEPLVHAAIPGRFAYLWVLGVDPSRRGEGLGRATVAVALEQMREAGFDRCVLKTEQPDNVGLYEHLGFEVATATTVPASGLRPWVMVRPTESSDRSGTLGG